MPVADPLLAAGDTGTMDQTNSRKRPRTHPDEYKRAYKACINCRGRKAKCIIDEGPDGALRPPCQRCKREMRPCEFRSERSWVKRKKGEADEGDVDRAAQLRQSHDPHRSDSANTPSPGPVGIPNGLPALDFRRPPTAGTAGSLATPPARPPSPAARFRSQSTSQPVDLTNSVMHTIVSSGSDALNLLFEAAHHRDKLGEDPATLNSQSAGPYETPNSAPTIQTPSSPFTVRAQPVRMSHPSEETQAVWNACRFVQMGWFSAAEAVTYIDLFFENLCPLSPILSGFYADHKNHYALISLDPFLCTTILMISARYNVLPGVGGSSRGYFIHDRLWEQCQRFIMKIMLGQTKPHKAQSRTVGSLEALLLLSEWHPRGLHFPTGSDGWDCELMVGPLDPSVGRPRPKIPDNTNRWLEDVIEPAKRSDRMSWMLLGCGMSLAQELGLFEENTPIDKDRVSYPNMTEDLIVLRRIRVRKLLYVFIEQLSWRLGCTSMIPQSLNIRLMEKVPEDTGAEQWQSFMTAWIELTKLARFVTDSMYTSPAHTKETLRSGRYIGLLEQFQTQLIAWREKHLDPRKLDIGLHDMLSIEYQYVRIFSNALGMQAVVERTMAADPQNAQQELLATSIEPTDYNFIQEVVDGSRRILQKVIQLSESGSLRFSPVRIFLRITTCSMYLIKGLSLGAREAKLRNSLDILERAISAMRSSTLDDMHLASRYATLLEVHVSRLRNSFVVSSKPHKLPSRRASQSGSAGMDFLQNHNAGASGIANLAQDVSGMMPPEEDWLSLPFDPSMAPFGLDNMQGFQGLDGSNFDFFWTFPTQGVATPL